MENLRTLGIVAGLAGLSMLAYGHYVPDRIDERMDCVGGATYACGRLRAMEFEKSLWKERGLPVAGFGAGLYAVGMVGGRKKAKTQDAL